jgi:hypothetical protein
MARGAAAGMGAVQIMEGDGDDPNAASPPKGGAAQEPMMAELTESATTRSRGFHNDRRRQF